MGSLTSNQLDLILEKVKWKLIVCGSSWLNFHAIVTLVNLVLHVFPFQSASLLATSMKVINKFENIRNFVWKSRNKTHKKKKSLGF